MPLALQMGMGAPGTIDMTGLGAPPVRLWPRTMGMHLHSHANEECAAPSLASSSVRARYSVWVSLLSLCSLTRSLSGPTGLAIACSTITSEWGFANEKHHPLLIKAGPAVVSPSSCTHLPLTADPPSRPKPSRGKDTFEEKTRLRLCSRRPSRPHRQQSDTRMLTSAAAQRRHPARRCPCRCHDSMPLSLCPWYVYLGMMRVRLRRAGDQPTPTPPTSRGPSCHGHCNGRAPSSAAACLRWLLAWRLSRSS